MTKPDREIDDRHATFVDVPFDFTMTTYDPEEWDTYVALAEELEQYLAAFTPGSECAGCGNPLGGLLGSFIWGIQNGEGRCCRCGWPARGHHRPANGLVKFWEQPLSYHPSLVSKEPPDAADHT